MSIFKKLSEKLGLPQEVDENDETPFFSGSHESKTEEINAQRTQIMTEMESNLRKLGFDDNEVNEVIFILNKLERDKQEIKDNLIGTNINIKMKDPNMVLKLAIDDIRKLELQAAADVKAKIAEIRKRKGI